MGGTVAQMVLGSVSGLGMEPFCVKKLHVLYIHQTSNHTTSTRDYFRMAHCWIITVTNLCSVVIIHQVLDRFCLLFSCFLPVPQNTLC